MSNDPFLIEPKRLGANPRMMVPTVDTRRTEGSANFTRRLGVVNPQQPLMIYTPLPEDELQGIANRNIVMPYFMEHAKKIHEMATPQNKARLLFVEGDPSTGKTFNLTAVARHYGAPIIYGCDGKRAEELLKQPRFSYNTGNSLEDRINGLLEKINKGEDGRKMDAMSLRALQQLGEAFIHDESGKYQLNWSVIGGMGHEDTKTHKPDQASYDKVKSALKDFLWAQGESVEPKTMEVKYVDGPIIQAIKQKKPFLILDEFTRMQDYGHLLNVTAVFAGLDDGYPLTDADGQPIAFKRGEVPILLLTGNSLGDIGVSKMPEPLMSRLQGNKITLKLPDSHEERVFNWRHVIEKQLTGGLPMTTMAFAAHSKKDGNTKNLSMPDDPVILLESRKEEWRQFFRDFFDFAISEEEQSKVQKWQLLNQHYYEDIMNASKHLAEYFAALPQYFDKDYPAYANVTDPPDLKEKIRKELRNYNPQIDYRTVAVAIMNAARPRSEGISGAEAGPFFLTGRMPPNGNAQDKPIEAVIGTQLVDEVVLRINEELLKPIQDNDVKDYIRNLLVDHMATCKLINQTGARGIAPFEKCLNRTPEQCRDYDQYTRRTDVVIEALKERIGERFPQLESKIPDDFISRGDIEALLNIMDIAREGSVRKLLLFDDTMQEHNISAPLQMASGYDAADLGNRAVPELVKTAPQALVTDAALLDSLTLPLIGKKNFDRLWTTDLSRTGKWDRTNPALEVAENRSSTGLAVTSVICKNAQTNRPCELLIVRNNHKNHTVIVGDAIDPKLKERLKKAGLGITYVNRHHTEAKELVMHLNQVFDDNFNLRNLMIKAFRLRHSLRHADKREVTEEFALNEIGSTKIASNAGRLEAKAPKGEKGEEITVTNTIPYYIFSKELNL